MRTYTRRCRCVFATARRDENLSTSRTWRIQLEPPGFYGPAVPCRAGAGCPSAVVHPHAAACSAFPYCNCKACTSDVHCCSAHVCTHDLKRFPSGHRHHNGDQILSAPAPGQGATMGTASSCELGQFVLKTSAGISQMWQQRRSSNVWEGGR